MTKRALGTKRLGKKWVEPGDFGDKPKRVQYYSEIELLNKLVGLINSYLNKKNTINKAILSFFKLNFKIHYLETIEAIIKSCGLKDFRESLSSCPNFPYRYE